MSLILPPQGPRNLTSRFFARFRRSIDASFSSGNRVVLLRSGSDFFRDLFASVEAATTSISLEFYIVRADRTGRLLAASLKRAVQRGVMVEFLYDYIGSFDTPASFFAVLEQDGIRCAAFNPPPFRNGLSWFDKRDHRKIAIIDCRLAYACGLNIGDEYAGDDPLRSWRDMGLRLEGPAAKELHQLFAENWLSTSEILPISCSCSLVPPAGGDAAVAIVSGGPHHNRSRIRDAFMLGMASAGSSIRIETPYFVPGPRFLRAMFRAARRGVVVEIILPARSDVPLLRLVNRSYYGVLLKGGVKVYERQGAILHAKVMLIDSSWAVIGSANLDQRSFHRNYEVSVIVASQDFGRQVEELIVTELAASQPIELSKHERRSWLIRGLEWLLLPLNWFL
ncbi:MAG: cardiolipin synthase B [Deltaproteobacteria bacterium HGW-Deltaproteobacteria-4]|nr:MAG: cardiolipin synthase B [Deltaproteobacteria bacterium HGW-Deltaproteobacteria-4]